MKNLVILIGNLGEDPVLRYTGSGTPVSSFSVATTERWKDNEGNMQEAVEWHKVISWGKLADICAKYLKKGSRVYIEGKIQTRKWQDQNNSDRYTTEIIAREMEILSPRNNSHTYDGDIESGGFPEPPPGNQGSAEGVPF